MILTRSALGNPVATLVAVLLVIIFGVISLTRLPIQLTPEIETPEITIQTIWRAAAPQEVEAEIIEPQEKVLRGLPGMTELLSNAQLGQGEITVKFQVGFDLQRGLVEVLNRLNRVARYPDDAEEPVLSTVGGRSRAIAWFIIKTEPGNNRDIASYQDYVEEVIQSRFERVPGVALSEVRGGREKEIRITFDPYKAAALGVQLPVAAQLAGGNEDVSAGTADIGKRSYRLRFTGSFDTDELGSMMIAWRSGKPVLLRDIAIVESRLVDRNSFVITKGKSAIAVNAHRESGINVLDVMNGLQDAVSELRKGPLEKAGLSIEQVYDETDYIYNSIGMLRNNLALGIILAVIVLWWFMRRFRATMIVASAIPVCIFFAFIAVYSSGRTLNVISLAGLAFAIGMVLDAAIVVLENIVRLRERGAVIETAAFQGVTEVWGALLASTATTIAIFLPVVFLEDEAGQLFADLALTIAVAVSASLLVALTIIPTAAQEWFKDIKLTDPHGYWWDWGANKIMSLTNSRPRRLAWIAGLILIPLSLSILMIPKADYLPEGNRNLVFTFIFPPPGMNIEYIENEMGTVIANRLKPHIDGDKQPKIKHYFFVAFPGFVFMGARADDPTQVDELVPIINSTVKGFPDTIAFAQRASLFGGFGEGKSIDVNIQGRNLEAILKSAQQAYGGILGMIPGSTIRPLPGLELAEPELRLKPDERRITEAGWDRETMARVIRAMGDGLYVGDYFDGEERLDIIVRVQQWETPEDLAAIPVVTPDSGVLTIGDLTHLVRTAGPDKIRRLDRRRTVTLQVNLPKDISLEEGLQRLQNNLGPMISASLPEDGEIRYSGTADKLKTALKSMSGSFVLAIVILYLLMSALFRSFTDSLLVLLALPLATVGGIITLQLAGWLIEQNMDLLTMIGFIILLGLVVNNAILLVHQTRSSEREGMSRRDAVEQSVHRRLRPILMTTLTSIFGMLPLLLVPGAGTELYRGLATVIVGGMSVSMIFTLILLPSLLRMGEDKVA